MVDPGVIQPTYLIRGGIPTDPADKPGQTAPKSAYRAVTDLVEVMGWYSNHADQGERLFHLLQIVPERAETPKLRTTKQVHRRLRPELVDDLVAAYDEGFTVRQLADRFGMSRETVSKILKRRGVTTRYRSLTADQTETALELYQSGLSLAKVGEEMAISRTALQNALIRTGVQLRPRRGWQYQ